MPKVFPSETAFSTRMSRVFYQSFYIRIVALLLVCLGLINGCATPPPPTITVVETSLLKIANQTDYAWVLTFSQASAVRSVSHLSPRQEADLVLEAGVYQIEQRIQGAGRDDALSQTLTEEFKGGHSYRWPLVTLLSETHRPAL